MRFAQVNTHIMAFVLFFMPVALAEAPPPEVQAALEPYAGAGRPGVAVGVIHEGELTYAVGFGMADLDHGVPLTEDSIFYMASVSKPVTAACIALLAVDGALDLDASVRAYVPELPAYAEAITVRHLVQHTSGMRDWLILHYLRGGVLSYPITPEYALDLIIRQEEPTFEPGARFMYCNSGYTLMAEIAGRVSGMGIAAFAAERLFEPLGMDATHYGNDLGRIVPGRATGYSPAPGDGWTRHVKNITAMGSGNVMSSVSDMAKFAANLRTGEVGGQAFIDLMMSPGKLDDGTPIPYGFGLFHGEHRGQPTLYHGGIYEGFRTEMLFFRDVPWTMLVFSNIGTTDVSTLAKSMADAYMAGVLAGPQSAQAEQRPPRPERPEALPEGVAEAKAGTYIGEASGSLVRVQEHRGGLRIDGQPFGPQPQALSAGDGATFRVAGETKATLAFDAPGKTRATALTLEMPGEPPEIFKRADAPPITPEYLTAFEGRYYSHELNAIYILEEKDGVLSSRVPLGDDFALRPEAHDRFGNQLAFNAQFLFERGPFGGVSGFELRAANVKGLDFERMEDE